MYATTAPTNTDSSSTGYDVGSVWIDRTNDKIYVCVDSTSTSAVWIETGVDNDAIHDNVAGEISSIAEKTVPVSADLLLIEDSADSNNKKRVQIGNLDTSTNLQEAYDDSGTAAPQILVSEANGALKIQSDRTNDTATVFEVKNKAGP